MQQNIIHRTKVKLSLIELFLGLVLLIT